MAASGGPACLCSEAVASGCSLFGEMCSDSSCFVWRSELVSFVDELVGNRLVGWSLADMLELTHFRRSC